MFKKKKIYLYFFIVLTCVSKLLGIGFLFFVHSIPTNLPLTQEINTEVIVVLTGGQKRITTGVDLLKHNPSKILFITGIDSKIKKVPDLIKTATWVPQVSQRRIIFGQKAKSTFENALETKAWLNLHHIESITIVTAAYHIPRSLLEFKKAMPNIQIKYYPVFPAGFKVNGWWHHSRSMILLAKEYMKYTVAFTRIYLKAAYANYLQNT